MKSRVSFDVVGSVAVGNSVSYPEINVYPEVIDGLLRAVVVEVEHDDTTLPNEIMQKARDQLRHLLSLIGMGRGFEPVLGAAHIQQVSADGGTKMIGMMTISSSACFVRGLASLPSIDHLIRLQQNPQLQGQLDHLNAAVTSSNIETKILWGYMVLEEEKALNPNYVIADAFRHLRNGVSHTKLDDKKAKAYFMKQIGAEMPDIRNPAHITFLQTEAERLFKTASEIVEKAFLHKKFWN
jgi:hypothetical protein